jgi:hypothetical protein
MTIFFQSFLSFFTAYIFLHGLPPLTLDFTLQTDFHHVVSLKYQFNLI